MPSVAACVTAATASRVPQTRVASRIAWKISVMLRDPLGLWIVTLRQGFQIVGSGFGRIFDVCCGWKQIRYRMADCCDEVGTRLRYTSRERIFAMQALQTFLWFDGNAEEAVDFWVSVFKGAKKGPVRYYAEPF